MAEKDNQEVTTSFKVDIADLKKGIQDAKRQIRMANAEFNAASGGMDNWSNSADGVSAKLKQLGKTLDAQESVLDSLKQQYKQVSEEQGENSKGAQELAIKIANQEAAVNKTKKAISKYNDTLEEIQRESDGVATESEDAEKGIADVGDVAKESNGKVGELAKGMASLAKKGIQAVATAAAGVVTAFLGSAEATREYREDINKLQTAYMSAGKTAADAKTEYQAFFSVLGEEDRSVEAVNHLAKLTNSQKELQEWTDICAGVWGTFGDSLPIEGLTEAANETAKVGQITGPLADAINWATTDTEKWNEALSGNKDALAAFQAATKDGSSAEDAFNAALTKCNSEQERSTLITDTLNSLYKEAADNYKELNGDIMEAQLAQSKLNDAVAEVGATAEPVMTMLKNAGADILTSMLPGIKELGDGFRAMGSGAEGAGEQVGTAIGDIVSNLVGKLAGAIPTLATTGVSLIASLVTGLIQSGPKVVEAGEEMVKELVSAAAKSAPDMLQVARSLLTTFYEEITTGIPKLADMGSRLIEKLGEGIGKNLPKITSKALDALDGFADTLLKSVPTLVNAGASFCVNLAKGIANSLPTLIEKAPEIITKFANVINESAPKLLVAAGKIVITLAVGIVKAIPTLVKNIPKIIQAIVAVWEAFNWVNLGSKAITGLKNGIVKMAGAAKNAGANVAKTIAEAFKQLPAKLMEFGKNGISSLARAIKAGLSNAKHVCVSVLSGMVAAFKPSSMIKVGKDLIKGLWNGISDMTGWVLNKINGFGKSVLNGIKKFFGIHSPSTVMRDQVGKYISLGVAEGISNNVKSVTNAVTNLGNNVLKTLKKNMKSDDFKKKGANLVKKLTEGVNSQVSNFNTSIKSITDKIQSAIDEVKEKQKTLKSNMIGMGGDLYTKDDDGNIILSDIKKQTAEVKQFGKNLNALKGKISDDLMNEILGMDADEAYQYTQALLALSSKELEAYNKAYTQKVKASSKIAKAWYKEDLDTLKAQYTTKVTNEFNKLVKNVSSAGENAVKGFMKAFKGNKAVDKSLDDFCDDVVKKIKAKFKIHSPSKVMQEEVGKYLAQGIAQGISQNKESVSKAFDDIKNDLTQPIDFNIGTGKANALSAPNGNAGGSSSVTNNTSYTYNQYNTSPKPLNRLEIYRQTKNQLSFRKKG